MKVFAYYLPQFHNIPVNDKWWGKGFTEWTSVKNAKPLFEGHYQPREPLNDNYYNLLAKDTMEWQAGLMHEYGVDGMCFYHYWFSSEEQVLEKPAENLLEWQDVDMPFCFSWANESWLNKWSNREGFPWISDNDEKTSDLKFIFFQKYGREDEWRKHFDYLLHFFRDARYIKINNKPLFVIHCLDNIPCLNEMVDYWDILAKKNGFEGLYIIGVGSKYMNYGIDVVMTHEPGFVRRLLNGVKERNQPAIYSYDDAYKKILEQKYVKGKKYIYTAFNDYDITPRYNVDGVIFENANPERFTEYLSRLMAKNHLAGNDIIFIDAWNEWAEGMHLEPDKRNGLGWLEGVRNAKNNYQEYLSDYSVDDIYISDDEYNYKCKSKKSEINLLALNKWMNLREKNISITSILRKYNINKVMVYGAGILSEHFIWECDKEGVYVSGLIDRNTSKMYKGIKYYTIEDDFPETDAIVVTAVYYMDEICNAIKKYHENIKVFSLNELLCIAEEKL